MPIALGGLYGFCYVMQTELGSSDHFFDGKFVTDKDPDAVAEFYQAEDLLKIIAVFPFLFDQFMNKVVPDGNEATEETALLSLGETHFSMKLLGMEVSFEIIEQEEENADGETHLASFIRHERFIDWVPLLADMGVKILLWDQTWKYGFRTIEDGKIEVYHHGEKFHGPWPIRIIIFFHQRYVLWACERFINSESFGTDDIDLQQEQLANISLYEFRQFVGKLHGEKEKALEVLEKNPNRDEKAIAEGKSQLNKIKDLASVARPTMTVVKRVPKTDSKFYDRGNAVKIVTSNAATQEVLNAALSDAKENTSVNAALKDLVKSPDLKFEHRSMQKSLSRQRSRKASVKRAMTDSAAISGKQ